MNNILYEVEYQFEMILLLPLAMLVFIAAFPYIAAKQQKTAGKKVNLKYIKIFCLCAAAYIVIISAAVAAFQFLMYNATAGSYQRGDYQIVEGFVANFDPMPYTGHRHERFDINGVEFEYSDYTVMTGYHQSKSHGGVITGNGQHLKIGYVYYNFQNIIVYIEQLPQDTSPG